MENGQGGPRLQKYLADCGVASRRKCEELIAAGRVSVGGEIITQMGVRVNCVCPGVIETPMTAPLTANPDMRKILDGMTPMGRMGKAEEIAAAVLWLCSDQASFVTGHPLVVDGGATAD